MSTAVAGANVIRFEVRERADRDAREVVPTIDGVPLLELIDNYELRASMHPAGGAYSGLIPAFFRFGPLDQHFLGNSIPAMGPKTPVLGCACGDWGCWPLMAEISVTDEVVSWDAFEQVHRPNRDYSRFGPFVFGRGQYEAALTDLVAEVAA